MKLLLSLVLLVCYSPFAISSDDSSSSKSNWGGMFTYSPYDLWLPGKIGLSAVYFQKHRSYELAYQRASYSFDFIIDGLGTITDQRLHLTTRGYTFEGSFNFQYGLYVSSTSITLGKKYLGVGVSADVISVTNLGAMWGMGNRWAWDNGVQFGVDWLKIFYPLTRLKKESDFLDETSNSDDKSDVEKLVDALSKFPQFTLLHFEVGYRF